MEKGSVWAPRALLGRDWYGNRQHMGPRAWDQWTRSQGLGPVDRDQWTGSSGQGQLGDQWTGTMGGPVDRAQGPGPVDQGPRALGPEGPAEATVDLGPPGP